jgi:hypothetical protein
MVDLAWAAGLQCPLRLSKWSQTSGTGDEGLTLVQTGRHLASLSPEHAQ